jgi:hypothetical protein
MSIHQIIRDVIKDIHLLDLLCSNLTTSTKINVQFAKRVILIVHLLCMSASNLYTILSSVLTAFAKNFQIILQKLIKCKEYFFSTIKLRSMMSGLKKFLKLLCAKLAMSLYIVKAISQNNILQ